MVSLILLKDVLHCSRVQCRTGIIVIVSDEVCWKSSGWRSWQLSRLASLLLPSVSTWSLYYREDKKNEAVVVFWGSLSLLLLFFPLWLILVYTLSGWMKLENCSKLFLDNTCKNLHIQLIFKNFPLYIIFLHIFLEKNSNSNDKYIFLVEPGEICNITFVANILLLAKKKKKTKTHGSFL